MQSLGLRFLGFVLLILSIFLTVGMLSYSTADIPDSLFHPKTGTVQNLSGPIGAWAVSLLLAGLGYASWFLLVAFAFESFRLLFARTLDQPILRLLGLVFVLSGLSTLCALYRSQIAFFPCPEIGPGGYLGVSIADVLGRFVARTGATILLASIVLGGLILLCDRTLLACLRTILTILRFPLGDNTLEHHSSEGNPQTADNRHALRKKPKPGRVADPNALEEENDYIDETYEEFEDDEFEDDHYTNDTDEQFNEDEDKTIPVPAKRGGLLGWLKPRPAESSNQMQRQALRATQTAGIQEKSENKQLEYRLPSLELLIPPEEIDEELYIEKIRSQADVLEAAFADFGLKVQIIDILTGPVVSMFELKLPKGLRLNKITGLAKELSMVMKNAVRIVAPIPGKDTVGIEVPNEERQTVRLRDVIEQLPGIEEKQHIPIFLGKDVSGQPMALDLTKLPHLLIAGSTGTGKSVCLNSLIVSMLMTRTPEEVRMLMIDPKQVELSPYKTIPHLLHPVVTDMRKAEAILGWAVQKMEERYQLLASAGVRQLSEFNKLSETELRSRMNLNDCSEEIWEAIPKTMPYIVIIADEMADLMMTAAKEVETHIIRLAQKSRAVGIHLVLATQKPTVDVITGLIKSNLPARIAFRVASRSDSGVVLDQTGADQLLGNGDMLVLKPGTAIAARGQGTYVSDSEIEAIIEQIGTDEPDYAEELMLLECDATDGETAGAAGAGADEMGQRDELYKEAAEYVIQEGRGSLSLLQRRFSIGYGRAARLIEFMEADGVVGPHNGAQPRDVLISMNEWRRRQDASSFSANGSNDSARASGRGSKRASARDTGRDSARDSIRGTVAGKKSVSSNMSRSMPDKSAGRNYPALINTANEPRRSRKYPKPQFVEPEYAELDDGEYFEEYVEYEED